MDIFILMILTLVFAIVFFLTDCFVPPEKESVKDKIMTVCAIGVILPPILFMCLQSSLRDNTPEVITEEVSIVYADIEEEYTLMKEQDGDEINYSLSFTDTEGIFRTFYSEDVEEDGILEDSVDIRYVPSENIGLQITKEERIYRPESKVFRNLLYDSTITKVYTIYAPKDSIKGQITIK